MKNQFIFRFCGLLLSALIVSSCLFAQIDSAKTLPTIIVTGTKVNEKVWNAFQESFKGAVDPKWYKIDKDFLVKFLMEDQEQSALFNKRGNLIYNIAYGSEKHLPSEIRKQIKSIYFDYKITKALSIRESDRLIWVINLEDDKSMLVVRVENGEMEEAKHYKKTL